WIWPCQHYACCSSKMQPLTAPAPRAPFRRPINRRRDSLESFPALGRRNAEAARRALRPEDAAERATVWHRRDPHPRPRHWPRDGGVHGGRRAAPAPTPRPRSRPPCCVVGTAARPRIRLFVGARRRPRVRAAHPIARASRVLRLLWRLAAAHSGTRPDLAAAPRPRVGRLLRRARRATPARSSLARGGRRERRGAGVGAELWRLAAAIRRRHARARAAGRDVRRRRAVHDRGRDAARTRLSARHGLLGAREERVVISLARRDRAARAWRNGCRRPGRVDRLLRPRRGLAVAA